MILGASPLASVSIAGGRFVIAIAAPTTVGGPVADVIRGDWRASTGSALYPMVNETEAESGANPNPNYIRTTTLSTCEIALGVMTVPGNRMRYKAASSLGNGLVFELLSDGVLVASWAHNLSATDDIYSHTLTPAQVAMMTGGYLTARMTATQ